MRFGLFTMPSHPPERSLFAGLEFDLDTIRWADELGYSEAWVGEHHTAPWEPNPAPDLLVAQGPHILPFQKPHPPIGVSGVSANSETLRLAGERGFIPMSPSLNAALMASHWTSVEDAARRVGRSPSRSDWRVVREVLVADTDE